MVGTLIVISPDVLFRLAFIIKMQINELLANHDKVINAIIKAKNNKRDGKINLWPIMKQSSSYVILTTPFEACKMST